MTAYRAIDLFAGIGGIRLAFQQAFQDEIEFVFSSEIYEPAIKVYKENFGERPSGDITKISLENIPNHDILLGGWPCQSFSIAGRQEGFRDPRGNLFFAISNILRAKKPYAFMLENVWYLERHDKGKTFRTIRRLLEDELGYVVYYDTLNAKHYGVPQNRPRIFILGFREPIKFDFPSPHQQIPRIRNILEKNVPEKYYISQTYLNGLKKHRERHEGKGNGFGYIVLDQEGIANALVIGGMGRERNLIRNSSPPSEYKLRAQGRKPNKEGIRMLTPTECKRLMGFPDWFKVTLSDSKAYRVLAESVAVPLVEEIAHNMKKALKRKEPSGLTKWFG